MYNEFDQNITKESDPVRQKHYTMKKWHFREKYRNTYKIKCYDKGFEAAGLSASLSFIKL